jgi:23S rRNA (guanosine2251-2'-O)-methyltransferase
MKSDHQNTQFPLSAYHGPEKNSMPVYGRHPVEEALSRHPEQVAKVYLRQGLHGEIVQTLRRLADRHAIPVQIVPDEKLRHLVGRVNHQGVVAAMSEIGYTDLDAWLDQRKGSMGAAEAVLLLDGIEDPHNMGAILRSAAASGMSAVFVGAEHQAPLSSAVMKASAGTLGRIPVIRGESAAEIANRLKEAGFWLTGLDMRSEQTLWDLDLAEGPMAFVVGNEGRGMRKKTSERCDFLIRIPMSQEIESLNASVSAALMCYEWARQRGLKPA